MTLFPALFVLYVGVILAQITIWWFVFGRLARLRPALAGGPAPEVPVSVIICARNEAANLRQYLPAVLEQQYPCFEVLVVDDDSSDGSGAVLAGFQAQYAHLRVLRLSPKVAAGKKYALAQGIAVARYEHLVFTDADCEPASPRWLYHLAGGFWHAETEIVLGYAPYRSGPGLLNRWVRFETIYTAMQYFSLALMGQPYMGVGRNLAWQKTLFQRVGGFATHERVASGDDDLLVNAAAHAGNTALCLAPEAFVYSEAKKSWTDWLRQKRRHLGAGKLYRRKHQIALGLLALTQILCFLLLFVFCFTGFGTISVVLYAIRTALASGIFLKILHQFRDEQLLIWFPLLDALLAIYFAVLVPLILIRSNHLISWK